MCNFYIAAIKMYLCVLIVSRGYGKLAETEVCIFHLDKIGELNEHEGKSLESPALESRWASD